MMRGSHPPRQSADPPAAPDMPLDPLTVRIAMATKLTGLSRSRIYELIQSGDLQMKKGGRSTLIPFADLKRLVGSANGKQGT